MASWNEHYEYPGYNDHHYGPADHTDGTNDTSAEQLHEAIPKESRLAQHGQLEATRGYQTPGPFTISNGLHSTGSDHVSVFAGAVNRAGGVRQGTTWTSDPAHGVARAPIANAHALDFVDIQTQGAGDTFESRQHRRWAGRGG